MNRIPENGAMNDPDEVDSYDRLSKNFLGLVEKLFVNRAITLLKRSKLQENPKVLDVGTGTANIPIQFARKVPAAHIIALDLSNNMLKKARSNIKEAGLENRIFLICADANQLPFKDESFQLVICHSIIHHLSNPLPTIHEIIRVTNKGFRFIIRDLRRPPSLILELYVRIFGFHYDWLMKKMYRESLHAGFTFNEIKKITGSIKGAFIRARKFFITHVGFEGIRNK
jgi:ubiquinone/menaquinone biosynthesis C-methylase UbiE